MGDITVEMAEELLDETKQFIASAERTVNAGATDEQLGRVADALSKLSRQLDDMLTYPDAPPEIVPVVCAMFDYLDLVTIAGRSYQELLDLAKQRMLDAAPNN